ncbi:hypothetical protein H4217_002610 [Coemansia sp. RSA 1939]|nr:hypothetical protein H4217_002610 [Coemansia sp. RSA 1939]
MNTFTNTVKSQTIWLDCLDAGSFPFSVSIGYWYENTAATTGGSSLSSSVDDFMPANVLEQAFYKTLQGFPILAGQLKTADSGRHYVEIDKDNLNMPVYTDTHCDLEYSTLSKSGFNMRKLPMDLNNESGVPIPSGLVGGKIVPAYFRIFRFKNNSGVLVYASIAHYITDGYGYSRFMNRWAETAKSMQQQSQNKTTPLVVRQYIHDRSFHNNYRSSETTALSASAVESVTAGGGWFAKSLAWLSPEARGRIFKTLSSATDRSCSYFHVSSQTLEDLRTRVQACAPEGTRYTINDVITAFLVIVVGQAKEKASTEWWNRPVPQILRTLSLNRLGNPAGLDFLVNVNLRPRIDHPEANNYMGNMTSVGSFAVTRDQIHQQPADETLSALALQVHQAIASAANRDFIGQLGHLMNSKPEYCMWPTWSFATSSSKFVVSNQTRFNHYGMDFGAGIPSMVRHGPHAFTDNVYVMSNHPDTGGVIFEFKVPRNVEANLIRDNRWMKLVDRYDSYL